MKPLKSIRHSDREEVPTRSHHKKAKPWVHEVKTLDGKPYHWYPWDRPLNFDWQEGAYHKFIDPDHACQMLSKELRTYWFRIDRHNTCIHRIRNIITDEVVNLYIENKIFRCRLA